MANHGHPIRSPKPTPVDTPVEKREPGGVLILLLALFGLAVWSMLVPTLLRRDGISAPCRGCMPPVWRDPVTGLPRAASRNRGASM